MNIIVPTPDKDYKVLVRCATYNQSKYICDALNGFAIQETDFPFICIVVDDASKDGNQDVIKQYANDNCDMSKSEISEDDISFYIRVPHKTNTNCVYLFCLLKVNLYCKPEKQEIYKPYRSVCEYEAICEGDDYWIDTLKLHKQVRFLDKNSSYGLVGSWFEKLFQVTGEKNVVEPKVKDIDFKETLIRAGIGTATCSVLFRIRNIVGYNEFVSGNKWPLGDLSLWLYVLRESQAHIMEDVTSVYRILQESASHTKSYEKAIAFNKGIYNIQLFFANKYCLNLIPNLTSNFYRSMFYTSIRYGKTKDAIDFSKKIKCEWKDYLRIVKSALIFNRYA